MQFVAPYPISANDYWRTAVVTDRTGRALTMGGKPYANTYVSKEAKSYKRDVRIAAYEAGIRKPLAGRVVLTVELYPARPKDWGKRARANPMHWDDDVRCIDLDNALKVLIDALRKIAYGDDAWVWQIRADRMEPDADGARVFVRVEPIIRQSPQLAIPTEEVTA
jgi:crossover junction endodeoxyribonuclease RusA